MSSSKRASPLRLAALAEQVEWRLVPAALLPRPFAVGQRFEGVLGVDFGTEPVWLVMWKVAEGPPLLGYGFMLAVCLRLEAREHPGFA
jgi:hypothetical protein